MEIRYFGRAAILTAYIATLGQIPLLSQSPQQPVRPQRGLEQRLERQQAKISLHSKLLQDISTEEERLLPDAKAGDHVSEQIGFLVYDDLEKLAERFNRTIGFGDINVYQVNGSIVVDYVDKPSKEGESRSFRTMIFYSDDAALESEGSLPILANFTRLKIETVNGRKTVQEDSQSFDRNFAYVIGMGGYDFAKVYDSVRALQRERSRLRKIKPIRSTFGDEDWYLQHPVDGIKFKYIKNQLNSIGEGLLGRYDLHAELGVYFKEGNNAVRASGNMIHVSGYLGWNLASGELEILSLLVRNKPEAQATMVLKIPHQEDIVNNGIVYPKSQ